MDFREINHILAKRRILFISEKPSGKDSAYYNAYLYANFGIVADKPEYVGADALAYLLGLYDESAPASYFKNPQDMSHYSGGELFVEQVISYFLRYGEDDCHEEIFEKDLPEYPVGSDAKLRRFHVISDEAELSEELSSILLSYEALRRPWSKGDLEEVLDLLRAGLRFKSAPKCKDNVVDLAIADVPDYCWALELKDLIKMSEKLVGGYRKEFSYDENSLRILRSAHGMIADAPSDLSKKQSKRLRTILKKIGAEEIPDEELRENSAERKAERLVREGMPVEAAEVFAKSGSKLQRHLIWILSRCGAEQRKAVLDLVGDDNPAALAQLLMSAHFDDASRRTFSFAHNRLIRNHAETDEEIMKKKSVLDGEAAEEAKAALYEKMESGFRKMPSIGKACVSDRFAKIALPINMSASGKGIDCLPPGSRSKLEARKIRTFAIWRGAQDIDSALTLIKGEEEEISRVDFGNFASRLGGGDLRIGDLKGAVWFSGDDTGRDGAEYYDLDLDEIEKRGFRTVIFSLHGFGSSLSAGEIKAGFQEKTDFMTKAWDPKGIAFEMSVKGNTRACLAFALDLRSREVITLNQMVADDSRVANRGVEQSAKRLLNMDLSRFGAKRIAELRSEPAGMDGAEIIFSEEDVDPKEGQRLIRPWDAEKLAAILLG